MSCLVYAIVFSRSQSCVDAPLSLPRGVGGVPVSLIEDGRLAAAVATLGAAAVTPTLGSVMAYAKVVEVLHASRAVVPMRYGCVLDSEADVIHLLHARSDEYAAALRELEGCVEMGICVLPDGAERGSGMTPGVQNTELRIGASSRLPGTAYLTGRRRVYVEADRHALETAGSTERIRAAFEGLFLRCNTENCQTGTRPVSCVQFFSIYFLVRQELLGSFRQRFDSISRAEHARFLLSGPWPPYNFVGSEMGDR